MAKTLQENKKSEPGRCKPSAGILKGSLRIFSNKALRSFGVNHVTNSVIPSGIEPETTSNRDPFGERINMSNVNMDIRFTRDEDGSDE
jgi:hypothetical protein